MKFDILKPKNAEILKRVLEVDEEFHADAIKRNFKTQGSVIELIYVSKDPKKLRSAVNSILENMILTIETIENFEWTIIF